MGDAIIRIRDVHKSFGDLRVLRGLSLDIARGETTVILGPSGCGKTVLLKHMIGLLQPDRGEVLFDGRNLAKMSERQLFKVRTRFGFLFQSGALFDSMSAVENVMFPLIEHGNGIARESIRERADECLGMVGVSEFANHKPTDLSGGQRKRVALARAIALKPEVILYDEPTTGLDPPRSDVINELIVKLHREMEVTSIVVTHDMTSAFKVGHRLVMMHKGEILADAPPEQFRELDQPQVQRFIQGQADEEDLASLGGNGGPSTGKERT